MATTATTTTINASAAGNQKDGLWQRKRNGVMKPNIDNNNNKTNNNKTRSITAKDIFEHNRNGGLWVAMGNAVLDLSEFQWRHPGGSLVLQSFSHFGQQAPLDAFERAGHSPHARNQLATLQIGTLVDVDNDETTNTNTTKTTTKDATPTTEPAWQKILVYLAVSAATFVTLVSYWCLTCNRDSGLFGTQSGPLLTIADVVKEILYTIYIPTQLMLTAAFSADYILLQDCRDNFDRLKQGGYSLPYVLFCMWIVLFLTLPAMGVVFWWLVPTSEPYFDLFLLVKATATFLLSDYLFRHVHGWMHQARPDIHAMHHYCRYPTQLSVIMVEPLDYVLEFWAAKFPILVVLGTNLVGYDGFACVFTIIGAVMIDLTNHDPWIKTAHYYHHINVSTDYGIVKLPFYPTKADRMDRVHKILDGMVATKSSQ